MMTSENHNLDELILQYLSGTLDAETLAELKQRISTSETDRNYVRQRIEIWLSTGAVNNAPAFDKEKAFALFQQRTATQKIQSARHRINWKIILRVAAIFLILVLPFAGYKRGQSVVKQTFSDIVVEAPIGARTKLSLPDGTQVWLNAGSRMVYSQGFGVDDRQLALEGEGYFEVAHNADVPFEIQTKEVNLRVLGTKFNFRNYSDDDKVTVDLMEGKVSLHNKLKTMSDLKLQPNEKMLLNKQTGEMTKIHAETGKANVWINNELFFDETSLKEIAKELMRNYNVRIEVADSLQNKRFYGCFNIPNNTIDKILNAIASTKRMHYRYENGVYILY